MVRPTYNSIIFSLHLSAMTLERLKKEKNQYLTITGLDHHLYGSFIVTLHISVTPSKSESESYASMNRDSHNRHIPTPSFTDLLQNSVRIHSDTTIRQDGRVQSYCGLRLTKTTTGCSGARIVPLQPPDGNRIDIDQITGHSTSKYASTRLRRRSAGPLHIRLAKKATKKAAFTFAG
ncbi:hypothetical protein Tco_0094480, partial [Tanacetum coccineum]